MCGIAGFIAPPGSPSSFRSQPDMLAAVQRMADALTHRGPDDGGTFADAACGVALGHRRLAIIDLSADGHQPMTNPAGQVMVYNGEIYNFQALRETLGKEGACFRGRSDTEVLLTACHRWGLQRALAAANGMFAFALLDPHARTLTLARDRLGEKPLYYGWHQGRLLFGSELKALAAAPDFQPEINRNALALYLRHGYIPAPYSIYTGIHKLPPAHFATISLDRLNPTTGALDSTCYWQPRRDLAVPERAEDAVDALEQLLRDSVQLRMVSDVPLGAFLSGGIDSSTIVALMQAVSDRPVRSFSIGFAEARFDESGHAAAVAAHLETDHTSYTVTPQETLDVIPRLPGMYDEPFADSSQVPTHLVCAMARQDVTVALSGDGGDELFYGYSRYEQVAALANRHLPTPIAGAVRLMNTDARADRWYRLARLLNAILPGTPLTGERIAKLQAQVDPERERALYRYFVSQWQHPSRIALAGQEPSSTLNADLIGARSIQDAMTDWDLATYLPDDILAKVDRAAMSVSLETRIPLLDPAVVEFARSLPQDMKQRGADGKWLLRQVLYRHVPQNLIDRPKMGFGVPIAEWLRGPLRDWAEDLLNPATLREQGYLDPAPIRALWDQHQAQHHSWHSHLWSVLMFQAWLANQPPNS